ncbi:MAG TPA: phosphotransferase family protein [Myxococcota bacterium]|nr:phosphotransferase family protein [Myxococcota bacterium]
MSELLPGIQQDRVTRFLLERVPGATPPVEFALISGGRSNLTYRVRAGARTYALRRPPLGHVIATAHDMKREFRVLAALADTAVPVPRPLALCEDASVNDAPFYVMEFRDGVVLQDRVPEGFLRGPHDGRRISQALVDTLATLHAVDYRAVGLADFGRPDGYLQRQVARWSKQWEANRTAPLPEIEELLARLARALPTSPPATIVHGDYRLGNMALDPDDPGRVAAIFDWEMATIGDPLADLGYTLIYWTEAGEQSAGGVEATAVTARPGFFTRAELILAYAKASGRDLSSVDFYQVLALTKLAVISEGIYKRFTLGKTVGADFEGLVRMTEPLARRALEIADRASDTRMRGR